MWIISRSDGKKSKKLSERNDMWETEYFKSKIFKKIYIQFDFKRNDVTIIIYEIKKNKSKRLNSSKSKIIIENGLKKGNVLKKKARMQI